ncbi:Ribosome biogenesis protein NSA2 [Cucumispora dikerogammari]|nr:Ribosome biogenesis protein NSA2 [Cucumispora dikerogammari]
MPQNDYVEEHIKKYGQRFDTEEKQRKKECRSKKLEQKCFKKLRGIKAKIFHKKIKTKKVEEKKLFNQTNKSTSTTNTSSEPIPLILMDNIGAKLNERLKEQRKTKAIKYQVPLPSVKGVSEKQVFSEFKSGKTKRNSWKRLVTKPTFVPVDFTRKPPKFERFIRPMAMRFKKANVIHPDLKTTFSLEILGIKQNPHSALYTSLGVLGKGTIIEVNVSELGLVTGQGKIEWARNAQIMNSPENDGYVNAILLI